jgi:hypothetical protein
MMRGDVSVVTLMADYEGPLTPFAVMIPVPEDVTLDRVRTIRRGFIDRIEELSAPRFHEFYEQDPCDANPVEQEWEHKTVTREPAFLGLEKPLLGWRVPREISEPLEPVFKGKESEFSYSLPRITDRTELEAWVRDSGYRVSVALREALLAHVRGGRKLLVARVALDKVELVSPEHVQLGAIRFWTRQPVDEIAATLDAEHAAPSEDLFVYVLHPERRFEAKNFDNVHPPTNLRVDPSGKERIATLFNALTDRLRQRNAQLVLQEFVWSTAGCGEPCSVGPLELSELMSLGADVLEAETVSDQQRKTEPEPESLQQKRRLQTELERLPVAERNKALAEHEALRRELARRSALQERHRYVLTRLHARQDPSRARRAIVLGPAAQHVQGGTGIPKGPVGALVHTAVPAEQSRFQVRLIALHPWPGRIPCVNAQRWRWGRRWESMRRSSRKLWLATDLARAPRSEATLELLKTPLPELGIHALLREPSGERSAERTSGSPRRGCACSLARRSPNQLPLDALWPCIACLLPFARRTRGRVRAMASR